MSVPGPLRHSYVRRATAHAHTIPNLKPEIWTKHCVTPSSIAAYDSYFISLSSLSLSLLEPDQSSSSKSTGPEEVVAARSRKKQTAGIGSLLSVAAVHLCDGDGLEPYTVGCRPLPPLRGPPRRACAAMAMGTSNAATRATPLPTPTRGCVTGDAACHRLP